VHPPFSESFGSCVMHGRAENFMTGLKVVFDRRRSVLGWEKFDCECFYVLA
jgi:hypothetical protein